MAVTVAGLQISFVSQCLQLLYMIDDNDGMTLVFNPPICPVNGSAYPGIERASDYMMRVIHRLRGDKLRSRFVQPGVRTESIAGFSRKCHT